MAFCSRCGRLLQRQWLAVDGRERDVCGSCHSVHYKNPKVLVACLIYWNGKIVLCRRATDPAKGYWYPPTGFVEAGETLEEAAARELQEEAGLEVPASQLTLYGVVSLPHINQIYVAYRAGLSAEPQLAPGKEALEAALFSEAEVPLRQLAFNDIAVGFISTFFLRLRSGSFPIQSMTVRPCSLAEGQALDGGVISEAM
jgi:ADP-ribose pyrophosphatase YjhB (NUDIX family)